MSRARSVGKSGTLPDQTCEPAGFRVAAVGIKKLIDEHVETATVDLFNADILWKRNSSVIVPVPLIEALP